jgi:TubC N-terminal docking domain
MTPHAIFTDLWAAGVSLGLAPDGHNLTAPAGRLTPEQRALVLTRKPELVTFLQQARDTSAALIEAAMARCDQFGDDQAAREAMCTDCLATPPHLQADLLAYLNRVNKP